MSEFDDLIDQHRKELESSFARKHNQLIATTEIFRRTLEISRSRGWSTHSELWNLGIYINMAAHDLSVLVQQLVFERDIWTRKLVACHVALLMFEVSEDMSQLLGKKIRVPLQVLGLLPKFEAQLRVSRQPFDQFRRQHQSRLNEIRCMSAAHRDLDGLSMLKTIEEINIHEVEQQGLEMGNMINNLGELVQLILNEASDVKPPELRPSG